MDRYKLPSWALKFDMFSWVVIWSILAWSFEEGFWGWCALAWAGFHEIINISIEMTRQRTWEDWVWNAFDRESWWSCDSLMFLRKLGLAIEDWILHTFLVGDNKIKVGLSLGVGDLFVSWSWLITNFVGFHVIQNKIHMNSSLQI